MALSSSAISGEETRMELLMSALPALFAAGASGLSGAIGGSKERFGSTYSKPAQKSINELIQDIKGMKGGAQDITQNQGYQQGQDWLSSLFNDPEFFKNMEAPAMRQFNEEIAPGIANRFASMGSGGALGSTGFENSISRAGSDLATNLAANRGQMQQQGVGQQLGYAQQPFSNLMQLYQQAH